MTRIDLPWSRPPLNLNDRGHWAPRAKKIADVRATGAWLARTAHLGRHERVRIALHYQPATRRARDEENLVATLKPLVDGLVTDAGLCVDDTDAHVRREMPVIHPPVPGERGRMWLVITPLEVEPTS